ncbi:hypothetical protein MCBG_06054 [Micromonospora sp. M42]|uniref:hypothetical protein n=1 Tax=Actinomycetes TaxID=1760 RepID=UPI0001DED6BC|nr:MULTISPECIES: hypothetical protein [Actinomycetes]EFK99850.1 predicted protein [Streptomyces sp. SPB78]EWM62855.1 hypothetical protein MCBG_06054 [Micromonospora sp. M42]
MKKNPTPEGMTCVAVVDGKFCGAETNKGELYGADLAKVPLCGPHAAETYTWNMNTYRNKPIANLEESGALNHHSPGTTYVVKLPNGRIKIGMTKDKRPAHRLESISREYVNKGYEDPLTILALIPGGESREAVTQHKFRHLRVSDELGEQFRAEPELLQFANETGIPDEYATVVIDYEQWWNRRSKKRTAPKPILDDQDEWDF